MLAPTNARTFTSTPAMRWHLHLTPILCLLDQPLRVLNHPIRGIDLEMDSDAYRILGGIDLAAPIFAILVLRSPSRLGAPLLCLLALMLNAFYAFAAILCVSPVLWLLSSSISSVLSTLRKLWLSASSAWASLILWSWSAWVWPLHSLRLFCSFACTSSLLPTLVKCMPFFVLLYAMPA